jgi:hypothetical protein
MGMPVRNIPAGIPVQKIPAVDIPVNTISKDIAVQIYSR